MRRPSIPAALVAASLFAACAGRAATNDPPRVPQDANPDAVTLLEFSKRVDQYVALHRKLESAVAALPDNASPEEIDRSQRQLLARLQQARPQARQGDVFQPAMQALVRRLLARVFAGPQGRLLRSSIMDENPVSLTVRVNRRYPDDVPLSTMPPEVLEALPKMPEELEYRFIGDNLIILDVHAHLIVDAVPHAMPERRP